MPDKTRKRFTGKRFENQANYSGLVFKAIRLDASVFQERVCVLWKCHFHRS